MAFVVYGIFIMIEAGFAAFECTRKVPRKEWTKRRLGVNIAELAVFLVLLLLPGISLSFRFVGLAVLLLVRLLTALLFCLCCRKSEKIQKKAAIVQSAVLGVFLLGAGLLPAWIFRDYQGLTPTGTYQTAYAEAILTDPDRVEAFETDGSHREVSLHFYYPENAETLPEKSLPLVIFSHGAFGYYQSNFSACTELASHGYVVVSLDHPYHAFFTKDTDGTTITADPQFFRDALAIENSSAAEAEVYDVTSGWMALRLADVHFVIDTLQSSCRQQTLSDCWYYDSAYETALCSVLRAVDYESIGLMGHSLGGATAVTAGRRDDISAVIDIDGTMLGEQTGFADGSYIINETPYTTPLLAIDNEAHHNDRLEAKRTGYVYANNVILDNAENAYNTYFIGAGHMNFTDLPLISPFLARQLGTGNVEPESCIRQVNALILQFFDCYLKHTGAFSVEECY